MSESFQAQACEHGKVYPICLDCFKKLESELIAMRDAKQSSAAVIVGYQEKFARQEAELNALREDLNLQKWANKVNSDEAKEYQDHLKAERDKLRVALEKMRRLLQEEKRK